VPLRCLECDSTDPAVWRYNLKYHLMQDHPLTPVTRYTHLWEISKTETGWMLDILNKANEARPKRARQVKTGLVISAAHSSRLALAYVLFISFIFIF
jgi:hypothetical protein